MEERPLDSASTEAALTVAFSTEAVATGPPQPRLTNIMATIKKNTTKTAMLDDAV
jgi:hypothetical protein